MEQGRGLESVVAVTLHASNLLLVRKRLDVTSNIAGMWHMPGGGVEPGENRYDAGIRELEEEAGITARPARYLAQSTSPKGKTVHWIAYKPLTLDTKTNFYDTDVDWAYWEGVPFVKDVCEPLYTAWPAEVKSYMQQELKQPGIADLYEHLPAAE